MNVKQKIELIKKNTKEIISEEDLKELLLKKKSPTVFLGTAVTGKPHIGYYIWVLKFKDLLEAGLKIKILLADLHAALDNTPWELVEKRYRYYEKVIPGMFKSIGIGKESFELVRGSEFQLSNEFFYDVLKMSTKASIHDCNKASSEVVKSSKNPKLSGLIYPIMQSLDEEYLHVDIQMGGIDQRKILMFAREFLPKIGYERRIEIMLPLLPGLVGEKMSASDENSKIDLLDDEKTIKKKLQKAYCPEGVVENNGVLAFIKNIVMNIKENKGEEFVIERPEKWGGSLAYKTYEEFEKDFIEKKIHPLDVKMGLAKELSKLTENIRLEMKKETKLINEAYPIK